MLAAPDQPSPSLICCFFVSQIVLTAAGPLWQQAAGEIRPFPGAHESGFLYSGARRATLAGVSRLTFAGPTGKLSIRPSTGVSGTYDEPSVIAKPGEDPNEERFALCP